MATIEIHDVVTIVEQLKQLHLEVPAPLLGVLAAHEGVQTAMRVDALQPLRDDIENGLIDIATITERIGLLGHQIAAQQQSQRIAIELAQSFDRAARRHLAAAHDDIIGSLRPVFDQHTAAIVAADNILGDLLLNPAEVMSKLGPAGATAWASFDMANRVLQQIVRATRLVYRAVDAESLVDASAFIDAEKTNYTKAQAAWNEHSKLIGLCRGRFALRLNTCAEAKAIAAKATASIAAQAAAQRDAHLAVARTDVNRDLGNMGVDLTKLPVRAGGSRRPR